MKENQPAERVIVLEWNAGMVDFRKRANPGAPLL